MSIVNAETDKTQWTTSSWTMEELVNKRVEFHTPMPDGAHVRHGVGKLWARRNPEGLLAIEIVTDEQGKDRYERVQTRLYIPQAGVDRLEKHPDQAVADFRLFMV